MIEVLLKEVNIKTAPLIEASFAEVSAIREDILGFLDDNIKDCLQDEIETILGSRDEFRVAFRLLIRILAQNKFTYKSQSSVLVKLFADFICKDARGEEVQE